MTGVRQAEWIMFHRLYVKPYNAFIDMCPIGFKSVLDDLGILSCERVVNRKAMLAFEATDDIRRGRRITESDAMIISINRHKVIQFVIKAATMYSDYPTNALDPYEVWLLKDWLDIDYGKYLAVNYQNSAL